MTNVNVATRKVISLLSVVGKLFSRVLIGEEEQCGFRQSGRSNVDLGRVEDAWIKWCLP